MTRYSWLLVLAAALACGDDSGTGPTEPVASVAMEPEAWDLRGGESLQLRATPRDRNQRPLRDRTVAWTTSSPAVATVSASGMVVARDAGIAIITASSEGKEGRATIRVDRPAVPVASVTLDRATVALDEGETAQLRATPRDAEGRPLPDRVPTWTSSDPAVASVTPGGLVTAHRAGAAVVTASVEGKSARAEVTVAAAAGFDLVFVGSASPVGLARLYLVRDGGTPQLLLPPEVLPGWGMRSPAASPDGRRIAFTAERDADAFVYVVDADGSNLRRLTHGGDEAHPTWSPDGTRIAYVAWPPGADADVWIMNADGSQPENLTGNMGYTDQHSPAWSPAIAGGSRIAFSDGSFDGGRILTMLPDGQDVREVTAAGDHLDAEPSWAPDGSQIVFVRETAAGTDLWLVGAAGGDPRPLVVLPATQANPAWSPDGRLVAFSSIHQPGSLFDVYTVSSAGDDLTLRSGGTAFGVHPAWKAR